VGREVAGVLSSGRSFSFWVTFVVLCGPILVAVPGAGGGKWIVVGGYSVGRGGARGFFFVDMMMGCEFMFSRLHYELLILSLIPWRESLSGGCVVLLEGRLVA
jgi:hypothetical protein